MKYNQYIFRVYLTSGIYLNFTYPWNIPAGVTIAYFSKLSYSSCSLELTELPALSLGAYGMLSPEMS